MSTKEQSLKLLPDAEEMAEAVKVMASFEEPYFQSENSIRGYVGEDTRDGIEVLEKFCYIERCGNGYFLKEDDRIRDDSESLAEYLSGRAGDERFDVSFPRDARSLDAFTESLDLSHYY